MALYCSFLRAEASPSKTPAETLQRVNQHLLNLNNAGMFVTSVYGILNRKTREFTYARAGHHIPILVNAAGNEITIAQGQGQMLGFFPDPILDQQTVIISPGSTLLIYTDGMFDVINENDEIFGEDCLREMIVDNKGGSAQELCDKVVANLKEFRGESAQFDDMTVVAVKAL